MDISEQLITAVKHNKIKDVKRILLLPDININLRDTKGYTALFIAAITNNIDIVRLLLENGADPNIPNNFGYSPLNITAQNNLIDIVKLLIDNGADLNNTGSDKVSPLEHAIFDNNMNMLNLLIDKGADLYKLNKDNNTPLEYAIFTTNIDAIKILLDKIDINTHIFYDSIVFDIIEEIYEDQSDMVENNEDKYKIKLEILQLLLDKIDINKYDKVGNTLLTHSIVDPIITQMIIDKGADVNKATTSGFTPLILAINSNRTYIIELLIEHGADVNKPSLTNMSPLYYAIYKEYDEDTERFYEPIINILLDADADVNQVNKDGIIALHMLIATERPTIDIIIKVVDKTVDINIGDNNNNTVLHYSIMYNAEIEVIKILLENGADPNIANLQGETPLTLALQNKDNLIINLFSPKWKGLKKSDINNLNKIFGPNPNNFSMCPVCLEFIEDVGDTMYIGHECSKYNYVDLYKKYKDGNMIHWCKICNRITSDSAHYQLTGYTYPKSVLLPSRFPQAKDCRINGGGGLIEKAERFRRYIEYGLELQSKDLAEILAIYELVEEVWNAPLLNNKILIANIFKDRKWNQNISGVLNNIGGRRITNKKNRYNRK